jgi:hypothetical protein
VRAALQARRWFVSCLVYQVPTAGSLLAVTGSKAGIPLATAIAMMRDTWRMLLGVQGLLVL